ncbi:MAG: HAD family hydrolase [Deltaproteobacteria bacterium]|nr:HAD family hydrolase [Deltaproteobacteria bacterium]
MKVQVVIFDLFGTLVDDFASSVGQMHAELAAALAVPYEAFMQLWRQTTEMRTIGAFQTVEASIEYVCGVMGVQVGAEQMTKAVAIRLQHTRRALEPRPDAVTTLARLNDQDYKVGLLSNCSVEIPILWQETALANLVATPIFSCRERLKKPDPRIYHLACERLCVMPGACLYVADGEDHELTGAAKVGLHPVLLRTSSQETRPELHQETREWQGATIAGLAEVLQLVRR